MGNWTDAPETLPGKLLCPQEWRIAELLARDLSTDQIAAELGISAHTVRVYIWTARRKVGCATRTGLALWAARGNGDV